MRYFLHNNTKTDPSKREYIKDLTLVPDVTDADVILVVGGDGTMLHAIAVYQHLNIPFLGIHAGTRGYLMNNFESAQQFIQCREDVEFEQLWLLEADVVGEDKREVVYGFNDIWVSRSSGQTLRMQVTIDSIEQTTMIVGDGILFCTPQGSTGYNLALRGKAISPGVPVLQMTPISCMVNKSPLGSVILSDTSVVNVEFQQTDKRPGNLFYDGRQLDLGPIKKISVKKSDRSVRIGFIEQYSFKNKVPSWQFLS